MVVRDLSVYIDSDLAMTSHVQQTVSRCFSVLRQLCSIRRPVSTSAFQSLVVALVMSRLDYCNSLLAGWVTCQAHAASPFGSKLALDDSTVRTYY